MPALTLAAEHGERFGDLGPGDRIGDERDRVGQPLVEPIFEELAIIGVGLIGWLSHLLPFSGSYLGMLDLAGLAVSIAAAAALYRWVEQPAQEMSSRLRFTSADRRVAAIATVAAAD